MIKVIQPNCRMQFDADDIEFIVRVLGKRIGTRACLVSLLADSDGRDQILDDPALLHALLETGGCLRISTRFYFYILVRHTLRHAGIPGRAVADYVAEMLAEFARTERSRVVVGGPDGALEYLFEMLVALQSAGDRETFLLRAHIGNYSLFLSGIFPDRIRSRSESRGFPGLKYYENLGRTQFRVAGDHRLAQRYDLTEVFATLAERFETTRLALNDVSERLFTIDSATELETILKGQRN